MQCNVAGTCIQAESASELLVSDTECLLDVVRMGMTSVRGNNEGEINKASKTNWPWGKKRRRNFLQCRYLEGYFKVVYLSTVVRMKSEAARRTASGTTLQRFQKLGGWIGSRNNIG